MKNTVLPDVCIYTLKETEIYLKSNEEGISSVDRKGTKHWRMTLLLMSNFRGSKKLYATAFLFKGSYRILNAMCPSRYRHRNAGIVLLSSSKEKTLGKHLNVRHSGTVFASFLYLNFCS